MGSFLTEAYFVFIYMRAVNNLIWPFIYACLSKHCLIAFMKRTKLVYHPFFTLCRSGRMFNLRPRNPWFEPYCLLVYLFICLFVCVYHGSDITTCTITSGLQILVTLCNDVRNGFSYHYMETSKHSSTQFLNEI